MRAKIFGNKRIGPCAPRNPLKTIKTAKGNFGKACRIQALDLEKLGADLEKLGGPGRP
jgi:hypothetical protein